MAASPPIICRLQHILQSAVQAVQWTYSLFWQFCPEEGMLIWVDGYYNGAIKTRKTVQPMEVSAEEASLQRSHQLRELYESLSAGESNQPARRPSAALSPEDLTESEWFYLMCVSFSFPPGVGLPGQAYAKGQHIWLTGANVVDSKEFSRAILAKSARIQTVVCIPLMDGVVELGSTERVQEDPSLIQQVKALFIDHYRHHPPPVPPKPALSEHSTSNPACSSSNRSQFRSPPIAAMYAAIDPPPAATDDRAENDEDDDVAEADSDSDSEAETGRNGRVMPDASRADPFLAGSILCPGNSCPSELMQLDMSEDIRVGSPEDASNNLDSDLHGLAVSGSMTQQGLPSHQQQPYDSFRAVESTPSWPVIQQQEQQDPLLISNGFQLPPSGGTPLDELSQEEDTHYSQTVSTILQFQSTHWPEPVSSTTYGSYFGPPNSAFSKWCSRSEIQLHLPLEGTSQCLLKYILFTVPFLHSKYRDENSPKSGRDPVQTRFRSGPCTGGKSGAPQDELSANHVLAERRRREKLNERFIILRSLVPFVTKMDKASILGDTIEYVKQLRKKIQDLEARTRQMELDESLRMDRSEPGIYDKKVVQLVDGGSGSARLKVVGPAASPGPADMLQVSIIESDALVELQCPYREGLLLDVMLILREMRVEVTALQSSLSNGFFVAKLRAKVKENENGRKTSIVEVKRAINQIVPHTDST